MSASFPRANRLTEKKDYSRIFADAHRIPAKFFVLLFCKNTLEHSRLGLAISKKHVAKATRRNRVKRQIREFFRQNKLDERKLDIVLISRQALGDADKEMTGKCLARLWQQLEEKCAESLTS